MRPGSTAAIEVVRAADDDRSPGDAKPTERPGLIEVVRRANAPPPPDHSVVFRIATTVAVVVGLLACESVGEITAGLAVAAVVAVVLGMSFSYATRNRPWQWLKVVLAVAVIVAFTGFVTQVLGAARTGQLSSVEAPLAALFTWVQVIHAFDVPARRDLLFSLAAAAALVTVAGAQALSSGFLWFAVVWLLATLIGLACSWRSMSGGRRRLPALSLSLSLVAIVAIALSLVAILPPPQTSQNLRLPSSISDYLPLSGGGLYDSNASGGSHPAQPARPGGRLGIGGYVGFDGPLNTADRGSLGNQIVMKVRVDRPGYFLGMTYDSWSGQSWFQSKTDRAVSTILTGSPFSVAPLNTFTGSRGTDVQTFHVEQPLPNLLFSTSVPSEVYFPSRSLVVGHDGSLRSTVAMTPGTVYTVVSADNEASPAALAHDRGNVRTGLGVAGLASALDLPHPYPRVARLARRIVSSARAGTTEAKVVALEHWIGTHTRYSTNIPPLRRGQDSVDEFLFGTRIGFCEQISTALAVMLRTLGIPSREAIGYVPGPFDPISDVYDIQAKDAHAWVQVYFAHHGWQSFDPTADVPLAVANPGSVLFHDALHRLAELPWMVIGGVAAAASAAYAGLLCSRWRRRRPVTYAARAALRLERLGHRCGLRRLPSETLTEYADRLEAASGVPFHDVALELEEQAYGSGPEVLDVDAVELALTSLRQQVRRRSQVSRAAGKPRRDQRRSPATGGAA